jgi:hypothetical protein
MGFLTVSRPAVFRGLFIRTGSRHFRQTAISGEARRSVDLLIGRFRTRIHEGPLIKSTGLKQGFQRLLVLFSQRASAIGRR